MLLELVVIQPVMCRVAGYTNTPMTLGERGCCFSRAAGACRCYTFRARGTGVLETRLPSQALAL